MSSKKGVFIHSAGNPDLIIQACKNLIQRLGIAEVKIEAAVVSNEYGGIKLYLNRDEVIQKFLSGRFLWKKNGERLATIHPLTTQLIAQEAKFLMEEEKLRLFIKNYLDIKDHQILGIHSDIPISENHPDIFTTDLRIILDVPEEEDLDVFKNIGCEIQTAAENEMIRLNFYCPICKKGGHTSWSCPERIGSEVARNSSPEKPSNSEIPLMPKSRNSLPSHEREIPKEINIPVNISSPEKIDASNLKMEVGEKKRKYFDLFYPKQKTVGAFNSSTISRSQFSDRDDENNEPNSKKPRTSLISNEQEQFQEISIDNISENDFSIIEPFASTKKVQHLNQASEEFEIPIEEIYDVNSGNISLNPGPSSLQAFRIPSRIKEIWEPLCYFQSIEKLEGILDHFKRRQNLLKIAALFDDHHELKEQFTNLRKAYYSAKKPLNKEAYKEERDFMDWFDRLVYRLS